MISRPSYTSTEHLSDLTGTAFRTLAHSAYSESGVGVAPRPPKCDIGGTHFQRNGFLTYLLRLGYHQLLSSMENFDVKGVGDIYSSIKSPCGGQRDPTGVNNTISCDCSLLSSFLRILDTAHSCVFNS